MKMMLTKFEIELMTSMKLSTTPVVATLMKAVMMMESVCVLATSPIFSHISALVLVTIMPVSSFVSGVTFFSARYGYSLFRYQLTKIFCSS